MLSGTPKGLRLTPSPRMELVITVVRGVTPGEQACSEREKPSVIHREKSVRPRERSPSPSTARSFETGRLQPTEHRAAATPRPAASSPARGNERGGRRGRAVLSPARGLRDAKRDGHGHRPL